MEEEKRTELESVVLEYVGAVVESVRDAKQVDQVIVALHSLAGRLFSIDFSLFAGSLGKQFREKVLDRGVPSENERAHLWEAFYGGAAFRTLARVLLLDVATNWLACFPLSAQKHIYDVFFVEGLAIEVVPTLVCFLQRCGVDDNEASAVSTNVERLLILCLLENGGMFKIARELKGSFQLKCIQIRSVRPDLSRLAQVITSIPDKAQLRASPLLSSHLFFKQITIQLLSALEENTSVFEENGFDTTLLLTGEVFSRICRRGSSDLLLSILTPRILEHVRKLLSSATNLINLPVCESDPASRIWCKMMEAVVDPHALERMCEQLLCQLTAEHASDNEAYWALWVMFHQIVKHQPSVRSMFVDKFLLWKVFPISCLRWIIQFSVLECPAVPNSLPKGYNTHALVETAQRLAVAWSKTEFVQFARIEQQAYISAALGICLENMSKEDLEKTTDVMHSVLQGVTCRLENPDPLVRKMASSIALIFSKIIDPKNPLYLDDKCYEEEVDWEFGMRTSEKVTQATTSNSIGVDIDQSKLNSLESVKGFSQKSNERLGDHKKGKSKKLSEYRFANPDETVDLATLNYDSGLNDDDDDTNSVDSDSSSDSSLQPYDLSDDDTDLKRSFTQLVDVIGALRKTDDAEGVERALNVAEKLVRASPDELTHVAGDLARTLVQVRCSDVALEGEEESTEEKRQRALVALVVSGPFESLETLHKLLYSPNVDMSQRIMILDIMAEAAQELSVSRTLRVKHRAQPLISTVSETQAWFLPSDAGPPGAGIWKEISETGGTLLNYSNRYERELPLKPGQMKRGKTRRWGLGFGPAITPEQQTEWSHNKFPVYAAAFMLPAMQGFDKKRHGVDLLGRDFIVLGKLIYTLGVCMRCASMHPEASMLATSLLDMLQRREVCHHKEAYVRRAVLFAAACVLTALHPSFIVSAMVEGNLELSRGLEWIRIWALQVADSDTDRECYTMAVSCLQLHAEMALRTSRALESAESTFNPKNLSIPVSLSKDSIKIPCPNIRF